MLLRGMFESFESFHSDGENVAPGYEVGNTYPESWHAESLLRHAVMYGAQCVTKGNIG